MAEAILTLGFKPEDQQDMDLLAAKAREGTLSPDERAEADGYERVGHLVSPLKAKARRSLAAR